METPHQPPNLRQAQRPAPAPRYRGGSRISARPSSSVTPHSSISPPLLASIFLNFDGVVQDFVISLKMLAVKRAETTVCPYLAGAFDLRTLRAIGVILLDGFKEQLKETAVDPTVLDRLALSRDPDVDANVTVSSNDFEVYRRHSKDQPKPNSVKRK